MELQGHHSETATSDPTLLRPFQALTSIKTDGASPLPRCLQRQSTLAAMLALAAGKVGSLEISRQPSVSVSHHLSVMVHARHPK